jgi:hypothetical protein
MQDDRRQIAQGVQVIGVPAKPGFERLPRSAIFEVIALLPGLEVGFRSRVRGCARSSYDDAKIHGDDR